MLFSTNENIRLADASTVKYIDLDSYTEAAILKNLEFLQIRCTLQRSYRVIQPKLNTLLAYKNEFDEKNDQTITALNQLVDQKRILKRPELKIYFYSVDS